MDLINSGNRRTATVIAICGSPGGELRRSFAANLTIALSRMHANVAVVSHGPAKSTLEEFLNRRRTLWSGPDKTLLTPASIVTDPVESQKADDIVSRKMVLAADLASIVILDLADPLDAAAMQAFRHADIVLVTVADNRASLDYLARFDQESMDILGPSPFTAAAFEARKRYQSEYGRTGQWYALSQDRSAGPKHKARKDALREISRRFGFIQLPGTQNRQADMTLMAKGLTWFDVGTKEVEGAGPTGILVRIEMNSLLKQISLFATI